MEHAFEDKGKVQADKKSEQVPDKKSSEPLTTANIQNKLDSQTLTQMQQTMGNAAVQRFLAQRSGSGPAEIDDEISGTINNRRGSGQEIDGGIADKAGGVMGQDFSGVKVHTDSTADNLSRQLGAKAFTTGNDIFFRQGEYNPSSSAGQHLISHELTHVVQQGGSPPAVQGKMTVNDPDDQYEAEADKVADTVMSQPADAQRAEALPEEEEAIPDAQMEEIDEEEKAPEMQMQEEDKEELA